MTSVSSRPVARLSSPGDIVASIPSLCGFLPADSVVVLSLRGPRRRVGLTIRQDLPPPALRGPACAALAGRVAQDGGAAAVLVVFAGAREPALVDAARAACAERGIDLVEALHVADGRWTSYLCAGACCPADGTPVPDAPPLVRAEQALEGRAVLASREDLVRSLAPPPLLAAQEALQALQAAERQWLCELEADGEAAVRRRVLGEARTHVDAVGGGGAVDLPSAARLAVALHDVRLRDELATWALEGSDALLAALEQVARRVVAPYDAPVCALLAWVAYSRGDGARTNVALDRALATDPSSSLALLLRSALDGAVPPAAIRRTMRATLRAVRRG